MATCYRIEPDGTASDAVIAPSAAWCAINLGGLWAEDPEGVGAIGKSYDPDWRSFAEQWVQPLGAFDAYPVDALVFHNGSIWQSTTPANVWEPGVSGWRNTPPDGSIPPWTQPTGAHDVYQIGDLVTHNGKTWTSIVADNAWEPGVFGWEEVVP